VITRTLAVCFTPKADSKEPIATHWGVRFGLLADIAAVPFECSLYPRKGHRLGFIPFPAGALCEVEAWGARALLGRLIASAL
jgi:hypothetical protein